MTRKQFIERQGATCNNWQSSWSFINFNEKVIIFGEWEHHRIGNETMIFSEFWQYSKDSGRKKPGYKQSREHIRLIEKEGYMLKTYPMRLQDTSRNQDKSLGKIKKFDPILNERRLVRKDNDWFAVNL